MDWDAAYEQESAAPWDIGRPQPAFVRLADSGALSGPLLDAGCGTGEHALLAAARGLDATGVDISAVAIGRARAKAAARGLAARFEAGDALHLASLGTEFGTVIDSGLFHALSDPERAAYVASLASVVRPGGVVHLMCFSDQQPGDWGPRRVRREELEAAFADGWQVVDITPSEFEINPGFGSPTAQAWLATLRRN